MKPDKITLWFKILLFLSAFLFFFLSSSFSQTISQRVISPFYLYYNNHFQVVESVIGEPVITTVSDSSSVILTQGFFQPAAYEKPVEEYTVKIDIFPNPVTDHLMIRFFVKDIDDFTIEVTDIIGKLVYQNRVTDVFSGQLFRVDLTGKNPGIYLIHVFSEKEKMKQTKKIIKL